MIVIQDLEIEAGFPRCKGAPRTYTGSGAGDLFAYREYMRSMGYSMGRRRPDLEDGRTIGQIWEFELRVRDGAGREIVRPFLRRISGIEEREEAVHA